MRPLVLCLLAVALAGCGGGSEAEEPPATLAASALPDLSSRARPLDAAALSLDSLAPAELERLLVEAGYVSGSEREFFGRSETFNYVVARVLLFESGAGGDAYLGWLRAHAREIVGKVKTREPLALGERGVLFTPEGCGCHADLPTYLAAWRRGNTVLWLLADGPGANRERFEALARELDARIEAE